MKAQPQLRLRACRAARKFVRGRAMRSSSVPWLPIGLRWRRVHAVATAGRVAMRRGAIHVHMQLRYAQQTMVMGGRESQLASRASPPTSRASTASSGPVVRELRSISTSSSHVTLVRVDRDEMHRVVRENNTLRRADHDETHRLFRAHRTLQRTDRDQTHCDSREFRGIRIGRAPRPMVAPRTRSRAPVPAVGVCVIAATRAQPVPMLRPVPRCIDATESRPDRRPTAVHPRVTGSQRTPQSQREAGSATQRPLSSLLAIARLSDLVWRAPTPAMSSLTAMPTTSARTPPSTIDATTKSAVIARIEALADAPHMRAAVRAQVLDPAIVERLADDVIRRIDRRARIERERRGL